jgi:hypothetical protein
MKWILFLCPALMALFSLFSFPGPASVAENPKEAAGGPRIEKYRYEAIPTDHQTSQKDFIEMEFIDAEGGTEYHSKIISSSSSEEISIQMDKEARFVSGMRRSLQGPERPVRQERIWRDGDKVVVERQIEGGIKRKEHRLPPDKELAVDGSLLTLLRFFPFDEGKKWNLFMVDFSGYSIGVTVLQEGRENISVPAGVFECYRLVTVVNIPVLKPKITYWLGIQKPNFLVKHRGKRGPFTPSYTTSLVSYE